MTIVQLELTTDQVEFFDVHGYLFLKNFYDVSQDIVPIQLDCAAIINQVAKRHEVAISISDPSPDVFDANFLELYTRDRAFGGEVYDLVKQSPAFVRLISKQDNVDLFRSLRSDSIPALSAGGAGIRIDFPGDTKFKAQWHQEYPFQLRSPDGIVYWSPLVPVDISLGPVRLCPGSHKLGALPLVRREGERTGSYAFDIHNLNDHLDGFEIIHLTCNPGDLAIFDFMTLHASGHNQSERCRWSMQYRYFNFNNTEGRLFGWQGSFANNVNFADIHPELFVDAGETT